MKEETFDELVRRYNEGTATDEEKAKLERWLAHGRREDLFEKISREKRKEIAESVFSNISARMERAASRATGTEKTAGRALPHRRMYRMAAAILLLAAASFVIWRYTAGNGAHSFDMLEAVAQRQINKVMLADGTIVWLKAHSSLVYPSAFTGAERRVTLTGEALFEVAKDADHPFIITTGTLTARVLGTSFNIRTTETDIEILVLTGKVSLSSPSRNAPALVVLPNEKALFRNATQQLSKVGAQPAESLEAVTKTAYSMNFQHATLRDIVRRIEGKFDVQVTLENENIGTCPITADFTDQSLETTLNMIAQVLDFHYTIDKNRVTVAGGGCD